MFFSSKKAVSPLIATVLLIAFAVALGAVVMNWGKGFVEATAKDVSEKSTSDLSCQQDIQLSVKEIADIPKICYNSTNETTFIRVMLENSGRAVITGIQYAIFNDQSEIYVNQTNKTISAGGVSSYFPIQHGLNGSIAQVEFTPIIKPKGQMSQLCSKNSLVVTSINECS